MPKPQLPKFGTYMRPAPAKLLQTAAEFFARKGFDGAAFREIAAAAGFSFQLISYHFGSKEDLWRACVTNLMAPYVEAMERADVQAPTTAGVPWLRNWMRTGFLLAIEDPQLRRMLTHESFSNAKRYRDIVLPIVETLAGRRHHAFATAMDRGAITRLTNHEAPFLYWSLTSANIYFPHEVEKTLGMNRSRPAAIEYQLDLLDSIFRSGQGIDARAATQDVAANAVPPGQAPGGSRGKQRRVQDGNQARQRLIESAMTTFSRTSYEGASMRKIAKAAGIAHPLLGYYFGAKEDLWDAAVQGMLEHRLSFIHEVVIPETADTRERVRGWISAALTDVMENPGLRRVIAIESFADSERYKRKLQPRLPKLLSAPDFIVDQIIAAQSATRFSRRELQLILRAVLAVNAVVPEEVRLIVGKTGTSKTLLDWQVDLLTNLFTRGAGELAG